MVIALPVSTTQNGGFVWSRNILKNTRISKFSFSTNPDMEYRFLHPAAPKTATSLQYLHHYRHLLLLERWVHTEEAKSFKHEGSFKN
jgi:hypothetical protein